MKAFLRQLSLFRQVCAKVMPACAALVLGLAVRGAEVPTVNPTVVLTNIVTIRHLPLELGQLRPPAAVTGVVTWMDPNGRGAFLDDGQGSVWVDSTVPEGLPAGTRVGSLLRAKGYAHPGFFTPSLNVSNIQMVGEGPLPPARMASVWEQRLGGWDGLRVTVSGTLFHTRDDTGLPALRVLSEGVEVGLTGPADAPPAWPSLPQRVTVTGISSLGILDRQPVDCSLLLTSWDQIEFLPAVSGPPPRALIGGVLRATNSQWLDRFVRLQGTVTWRQADRFVMQDESGGILVRLTNALAPAISNIVSVLGVASRSPQRMEFTASSFEMHGKTNLPAPRQLAAGEDLKQPDLLGRRVTLAGRLVYRHWPVRNEEWLLVRTDPPEHFRAVLPVNPPSKQRDGFPTDSTMEITGIFQRDAEQAGRLSEPVILVSRNLDVEQLSPPPLSRRWSLALAGITGFSVLVSLAGVAWSWHSSRLARLRQAQLETEKSLKSRVALIAETASDQIVTLDFDGRITFINPVGSRLLGPGGGSLLGQTYAQWIAPEHRERWAQAVSKAVEGLEVSPFDVELERGDGSRMEVEMVLRRLNEREIQCIGRDLTEARRTQRALARQELQLRTIVDSMAEGIVVIDSAATVLSLNPAAERIMMVPRQAVVGTPLTADWQCQLPDGSPLPPEDYPIIRTLRTGQAVDAFQLSVMCGDGRRRWLSINSRVLIRDAVGHPQQVVATFSDITARWAAEKQQQELEEKLRRSETLRALGTLAGGVAHDFNNLLASILGNAELTLMEFPAEHPASQNAREVATAAHRGADLVRRILSFSRPQPAQRVVILLSSVVGETARVVSKVVPPGARFHWHAEPGELPIEGDPTQLNQVIVNLCTNAAHALEEKGGELELIIAPAEVTLETAEANPPLKAGPAVRLTVRDTGCGMDAATLTRLFEPFFTTKGPGRGTGLGMAIVHSVVQAHEGRVTVESKPGQGTRIDIVFPAVTEGSSAGNFEIVGEEILRGRNEELLVVDDDPAVLRYVGKALSRLGYRVTAVESPIMALAHLRAEPDRFQLLLTDLSMPERSGVDLALAARALRADLPIIIATGYGPTAHQQLARAGNQFPVLSKPFRTPELARLLRSKLDRPLA